MLTVAIPTYNRNDLLRDKKSGLNDSLNKRLCHPTAPEEADPACYFHNYLQRYQRISTTAGAGTITAVAVVADSLGS